jgi:CRP-like cAMP-binding protein
VLILRERHALKVPAELREFYEQTFAALTPGEFLKIWKLGAIETRADQVLVREGERSEQLFFLLDGEVRVEKAARTLARLGRGRFLAEMGFLTGEAASADARAMGSVRYMAWNSGRLRQLRSSSPLLWTKLLSALGKDLVNKIKIASDTPAG